MDQVSNAGKGGEGETGGEKWKKRKRTEVLVEVAPGNNFTRAQETFFACVVLRQVKIQLEGLRALLHLFPLQV